MQHVELGSPSSWGSTPPGRCATGSPGRDRCGERPGPGTSDAQRTAELERENRELRTSNAILRSASLVGWTGDPYDNALAEAFNSLFKAGSSATVAPPGAASTISRSPTPSTPTGSTADACTARSAWSYRPCSRTTTTGTTRPRLPSRQFPASTEPGTRQTPVNGSLAGSSSRLDRTPGEAYRRWTHDRARARAQRHHDRRAR